MFKVYLLIFGVAATCVGIVLMGVAIALLPD